MRPRRSVSPAQWQKVSKSRECYGARGRVHELAKEFGVSSKEVIALLAERGEHARSASSTVTPASVRALRQEFAHRPQTTRRPNVVPKSSDSREPNGRSRASAKRASNPDPKAAKARKPKDPHSRVGGPVVAAYTTKARSDPFVRKSENRNRRRRLTDAETRRVRDLFQQVYAAGNSDTRAIDQLVMVCASRFGVDPNAVRAAVAKDRSRNPNAYRKSGMGSPQAVMMESSKARGQGPILYRLDVPDIQRMANDVIQSEQFPLSLEDAINCLSTFVPNEDGEFGYLALRYTIAARRLFAHTPRTSLSELQAVAKVVDVEVGMLAYIRRREPHALDSPELASRLFTTQWEYVSGGDEAGLSPEAVIRRARSNERFLHMGLLLSAISPFVAERLWKRLPKLAIPGPKDHHQVPHLISTLEVLADSLAAVESVLAASDDARDAFFTRSAEDVLALQSEPLRRLAGLRELAPARLNGNRFDLLPAGEQLRQFLHQLRTTTRYRGYHVDPKRVAVLEDIEGHFGRARCRWHEGSSEYRGVDSQYLLLAIRAEGSGSEHAVAISPLAGRHATFVVKAGDAQGDWLSVLAKTKSEAVKAGARRFLFAESSEKDRYESMRDRIIRYLASP